MCYVDKWFTVNKTLIDDRSFHKVATDVYDTWEM